MSVRLDYGRFNPLKGHRRRWACVLLIAVVTIVALASNTSHWSEFKQRWRERAAVNRLLGWHPPTAQPVYEDDPAQRSPIVESADYTQYSGFTVARVIPGLGSPDVQFVLPWKPCLMQVLTRLGRPRIVFLSIGLVADCEDGFRLDRVDAATVDPGGWTERPRVLRLVSLPRALVRREAEPFRIFPGTVAGADASVARLRYEASSGSGFLLLRLHDDDSVSIDAEDGPLTVAVRDRQRARAQYPDTDAILLQWQREIAREEEQQAKSLHGAQQCPPASSTGRGTRPLDTGR